jgi:sugar fermentation stimulation protein A
MLHGPVSEIFWDIYDSYLSGSCRTDLNLSPLIWFIFWQCNDSSLKMQHFLRRIYLFKGFLIMDSVSFFPDVVQGRFIRRLNRFVVECSLGKKIVRAHLPNPGRLWELLLPGRVVSLVKSDEESGRSTEYTAVAVEREGVPVLLHTQMANTVVRHLLENKMIDGFENTRIMKREAVFGKSRFDFLLQKGDEQYILEVKSCTLFGKHIAMFPDAVTQRGRKHLLELADLTQRGMNCGVVFLVNSPHARFFLPDYHTDIAFARTFCDVKDTLAFKAIGVTWNEDLSLGREVRELMIPCHTLEAEVQNRGCYMLILHIPDEKKITVGSLGFVHFPSGYYIYVGSAKTNLTQRIARHLREKKSFFWHIDYLRNEAATCSALPIRSSAPLEHEIALAVNRIADWSIPGFGASDCSCATHLFAMHGAPVHSPQFIELLQHFRMDRLGEDLD